jgi:hypothetical protein
VRKFRRKFHSSGKPMSYFNIRARRRSKNETML